LENRGAYDAGNGFRALDDITEKLLPMVGVVTQCAEVEDDLKQVLRLEAGIVLLAFCMLRRNRPEPTSATSARAISRSPAGHATIVRPAERAAAAASFQNLVDVRAGSLDAGIPKTKPVNRRSAT